MSTVRRALVLAPMTSELKPLVRYTGASRAGRPDLHAYTARVGSIDIVMVRIGVGPEVARAVTAQALSAFPADHVLVSGIAGGLAEDLPVGSVVVPATVLDIASGHEFAAASIDGVAPAGKIGVADHLITDERKLAELRAEGVIALEMESSGVAAACEEAEVPWTTFRVIGDRPDEGLTDETVMSFLRPDGTTDALAAVRFLLTHPRRVPGLLRLGRDSSMAASKAARATLTGLGWRQWTATGRD